MKNTIGNSDGFRMKIEMTPIFTGLGAERLARKAVDRGHPRATALAASLERPATTRRSSKWKNSVRSLLLPLPYTGEAKGHYLARARETLLAIDAVSR